MRNDRHSGYDGHSAGMGSVLTLVRLAVNWWLESGYSFFYLQSQFTGGWKISDPGWKILEACGWKILGVDSHQGGNFARFEARGGKTRPLPGGIDVWILRRKVENVNTFFH